MLLQDSFTPFCINKLSLRYHNMHLWKNQILIGTAAPFSRVSVSTETTPLMSAEGRCRVRTSVTTQVNCLSQLFPHFRSPMALRRSMADHKASCCRHSAILPHLLGLSKSGFKSVSQGSQRTTYRQSAVSFVPGFLSACQTYSCSNSQRSFPDSQD